MTTPPCHALETQPFSGCSWGGPLVGGPPPLSLPAAFVGLALSSPRDCCAALRRAWDLRLLYPHELPGSPRCLPSLSVAALPPCRASLNYGSSAGEGGACRTRHVHARSASAVHWGGGGCVYPLRPPCSPRSPSSAPDGPWAVREEGVGDCAAAVHARCPGETPSPLQAPPTIALPLLPFSSSRLVVVSRSTLSLRLSVSRRYGAYG